MFQGWQLRSRRLPAIFLSRLARHDDRGEGHFEQACSEQSCFLQPGIELRERVDPADFSHQQHVHRKDERLRGAGAHFIGQDFGDHDESPGVQCAADFPQEFLTACIAFGMQDLAEGHDVVTRAEIGIENITGDEFNPSVSAWRGFIGLPPAWKGSYLHRADPMPSKVVLSQGNLAYLPNGHRIYVPFDVSAAEPICPDQRGYWGDYDHSIHAGFNSNNNPVFFRPMSDSSQGCTERWAFTSSALHLRGFVFE